MLVNDKDAVSRLTNPDNLINRLRTLTAKKPTNMGLFGMNAGTPQVSQVTDIATTARTPFDPFNYHPIDTAPQNSLSSQAPHTSISLNTEPPKIDDLLDSADSQIKLTTAHNTALDLLGKAVKMMGDKLDDIKPDKLPSVIAAASKTVDAIRKEKIELGKSRKERNVHFHFYEPERKQLSDYQTIDV